MKIFISHSSKNENYGNEFVNLLTGIGVNGESIIFTSNDAYGIPIGENIFEWLKNRISEKPHVIYLLSPEYYKSVACLNEMGAAWVIENKHTMVFTPDFKLDSYEFQNGAIDPREIGFYINNQSKIIAFIESLRADFQISKNQVLINQKISTFLENIKTFKSVSSSSAKGLVNKPSQSEFTPIIEKELVKSSVNSKAGQSRLFADLLNDKLKDEEVLLIHYIKETARFKLGTGWQESNEIENIETWEDIQELNNSLSKNYAEVLRRFEMKNLTEVSEITSHGNPKEIKIKELIQKEILNHPEVFEKKIAEVIKNNPKETLW